MKTIIFIILAGIIPAIIPGKAFSQISNDVAIKNKAATKSGSMLITKVSENAVMSTANEDAAHIKAFNDFEKYYSTTGEKWMNGVDCIVATFKTNDKSNWVFYDKKGRWIGSESTYDGSKLPADIKQLLETGYPNSKVIGVNEIKSPNSSNDPYYLVTIEGRDHYKWILIANGQMNVYKELKKVSQPAQ